MLIVGSVAVGLCDDDFGGIRDHDVCDCIVMQLSHDGDGPNFSDVQGWNLPCEVWICAMLGHAHSRKLTAGIGHAYGNCIVYRD